MKPCLLLALLLSTAGLAPAEKDAPPGERPAQSGRALHELSSLDLFLRKLGSPSELAEKKCISLIEFLSSDTTLQAELLRQFEKDHPRFLKEALASAGNLHNPKVQRLRGVFSETLLKTPTIGKMEERFNKMGLTIGEVEFEKFHLEKSANPVKFRAFVWLILKTK